MLAKHNLLTIVSFGALLMACAPKDTETAAVDSPAETAAAVAPVGGGEYTGAEMFGFLNAVSDGDIEAGTFAQTKATDAQVKALGARFVGEHQALKAELATLSAKLGITPTLPKDEEDMVEDHKKAMTDLQSKAAGREWDEAYLEHEVKMHKHALEETEEAAKKEQNSEMKALLEKAVTSLKAHLTAAEELEKKFGV